MRFNKPTRIVAAIAVIGAVAAGGAAFTASNGTLPATVAGFSSANVTGGTVESLSYTLSGDGTTVDSATIVFLGDTRTDSASIGFGGATQAPCTTGTTLDGAGNTTYTCTLSGVTTANVATVQVALVNNPVSGT